MQFCNKNGLSLAETSKSVLKCVVTAEYLAEALIGRSPLPTNPFANEILWTNPLQADRPGYCLANHYDSLLSF